MTSLLPVIHPEFNQNIILKWINQSYKHPISYFWVLSCTYQETNFILVWEFDRSEATSVYSHFDLKKILPSKQLSHLNYTVVQSYFKMYKCIYHTAKYVKMACVSENFFAWMRIPSERQPRYRCQKDKVCLLFIQRCRFISRGVAVYRKIQWSCLVGTADWRD